jgi:Tol biopolymer transport system component
VLLTCALGACVVMFVAPPKIGQASPPVKNGKIAYSGSDSNPASSENIYTISPTGGKPFNVTNYNTTSDGYPAALYPDYSPDGNKIAYVELAPPKNGVYDDGEIYTINATGGSPFQVTNNTTARSPQYPSYSPDGTKIAYAAHDGNNWQIYTVDASGGKPFQVTKNTRNDYYPSWGSVR